jgi:hypothetical protein
VSAADDKEDLSEAAPPVSRPKIFHSPRAVKHQQSPVAQPAQSFDEAGNVKIEQLDSSAEADKTAEKDKGSALCQHACIASVSHLKLDVLIR